MRQLPSRHATSQMRLRRWGMARGKVHDWQYCASRTRHATPQPASASRNTNHAKSRPPFAMNAPGTFSQSATCARVSLARRSQWNASDERVPDPSAMPCRLPATEIDWHGVPPLNTSRR